MPKGSTTPPVKHLTWVYVSAAAFLISMAGAVYFVTTISKTAAAGIAGQLYYIILIPLGLCVAAFLFGALRSYAHYQGRLSIGKIELTGPIVAFAGVVVLGFVLSPTIAEPTFSLAVRLENSKDRSNIESDGNMILYLPGNPGEQKTSPISGGKARFDLIPARFRSQKILLDATAKGFISHYKDTITLPTEAQDLVVSLTPAKIMTHVYGTIFNMDGNPAKDALLDFASGTARAKTDSLGNFRISLPLAEGTQVPLAIYWQQKLKFNDQVTLSGAIPVTLKLQP